MSTLGSSLDQPILPEYRQLWSYWNVGNRAEMAISTDFRIEYLGDKATIIPSSISFQCSRKYSCIDADIYDVFINIIRGRTNYGIVSNPGMCPHNLVTAGCGNKRGNLSECRCEVLNRVSNPSVRESYEVRVINQILQILDSQNIGCFNLKLAIFCSGGLLGEEILLFRLFDQLRRRNASGVLELFLIDTCYDQAIKTSAVWRRVQTQSSIPLQSEEALGKQKDLEQFLVEICKCLQPSITITGTVFDSGEKYVSRANDNADFKHHLLIGSDIENANFAMGRIGSEAGLGIAQPIALIKAGNIPHVCELDSSGNLQRCYVPDTTTNQARPIPISASNNKPNCNIL